MKFEGFGGSWYFKLKSGSGRFRVILDYFVLHGFYTCLGQGFYGYKEYS